ncbi:hypothetical protein F4679DRAFT_547958 [Xylaria curta]|nr:hypothetical protein F4679DRAFT_547958 [Xylaria curta]
MPDQKTTIMPAAVPGMTESVADEPIAYQQGHSVLYGESQADISPSQTPHGLSDDSANLRLCWRPFYLRRLVLLGFISVFILIIVAIEALLAVSNRDQGLATSSPSKHYLWTYGPTAFLTGVAALWARTEYQSKLVAPWIRLSQNPAPASCTLLLDYISQFSLFAIFTSLNKRDFLVSIAITVSFILKILIVMSTSLISLSWISFNQNSCPMILLDKFVDKDAGIIDVSVPYVVQDLRDQNLALREGISSDYAFQSVQTNLPDTAETNVTVDGLVNSLNCQPVDFVLTPPSPGAGYWWYPNISLPSCNGSPGIFEPVNLWADHSSLQDYSILFARFALFRCDGIPDGPGQRIGVIFGNLTYHIDDLTNNISDSIPSTVKSTILLCIPEYTIDRVQVIRNNTLTRSVKRVQGAPRRTLKSVTAWNIMMAQHIDTRTIDWLGAYGRLINVSGTLIDTDSYMHRVLYSNPEPRLQAMDLFDFNVLQKTTEYYYRELSAFIAKKYLMEPTRTDTVGSAIVDKNRLIVSSWIAQWMAAFVAVCVVLTTIMLFTVPSRGLLPYSPTTFLDLISILFQSRQLLTQLRYTGASDNKYFVQFLRRSTFQSRFAYEPSSNQNQFSIIDIDYGQNSRTNRFPQISSKLSYPIILHPACRFTICLSVISLIVALELLLRMSDLEDGLGNVNHNTYIYYTWTAVPALILGLLSVAFSAVDLETRTLAPYIALKQYISRDVFKRFELLDMMVPTAIYREAKLKSFWALTTTAAVLLASLFTTFSASLFQELSIPTAVPVVLKISRSFLSSSSEVSGSTDQITFWVPETNYSFPRFTYMDLSFPELTAVTTPAPSFTHGKSAVSVSAVIPAVRGRMDCHFCASDKIHVECIESSTPDGCESSQRDFVLAHVWIDDHGSPKGPGLMNFEKNATYFGFVQYTYFPRPQTIYFWAKKNTGGYLAFQHTAALICNITSEILDVNTTFTGTEFDLDSRNPPQPLEATVRNISLSKLSYDEPRNWLAPVSSYTQTQQLAYFFDVLVTSPWAIPMSALGDPSMNDDVIAAIRLHQGIILAQRFRGLLAPANETNVTLVGPISPGDNDAQRVINATMTDATGRRRIVQDAASTHILVALLATTLVLFVIGWATSPSTDVLPRSPTTIASAAALLAGGNIFDRLPQGTPSLSPEEIVSALGGPKTRFWMGWGNLRDKEGIGNGGENEGGVSQFGIFVVDEDDMHRVQGA